LFTNINIYDKLTLTKTRGKNFENSIQEYRKPFDLSQHRLGKRVEISSIFIANLY